MYKRFHAGDSTMTVSKVTKGSRANRSVDEMLQLARDVVSGDTPAKWLARNVFGNEPATQLADAVIELLSAPEPKYKEVDFDSPNPNCPIRTPIKAVTGSMVVSMLPVEVLRCMASRDRDVSVRLLAMVEESKS